MSKFKVGDQVTIKPGTQGIGDRKYGVPYTVTDAFESYGGSVELDSTVRSESVTYADSEVELYEPDHVVFKPEADALEEANAQDSSRGVFVSLEHHSDDYAEHNVRLHDTLLSALKDANGSNREVFFAPYSTAKAGSPVWEAIQ